MFAKLIAAIVVGLLFVLLLAGFSAIGGFIFQLLFNYIAPIFWKEAPVLTFYQAWAISFALAFVAGRFKRK